MNIDLIVNEIKKGKIIVFPTDTVYGIGCYPYLRESVQKIYQIKKRNLDKKLPILGYSKKDLEKIVKFDKTANDLAKKFWPGPLTMILKIKDNRLKNSLNLKEELAVRIPKNDCVQKILKECKFLIGTSANISGNTSYTNPNECIKYITGYDIFIDGGIISSLGESTIVKIQKDNFEIIREGIISRQDIINAL